MSEPFFPLISITPLKVYGEDDGSFSPPPAGHVQPNVYINGAILRPFVQDESLEAKVYRHWLYKAKRGDKFCQCCLGYYYAERKGQRNLIKAFDWWSLAASLGDIYALYRQGLAYFNGLGVEKDLERGLRLRGEAAEAGHPEAIIDLARAYHAGDGVPMDPRKAAYYWKKGADFEIPYARYMLGLIYLNGDGVPQDYDQAVYWLSLVAGAGMTEAYGELAVCYYNGLGVPKNLAVAYQMMEKAAAAGSLPAMFNLSIVTRLGVGVPKDPETSLKWLTAAAERGYPIAAYNLAHEYYYGLHVLKNDEKARLWITVAAEQGFLPALVVLGRYRVLGVGAPPQIEAGLEILRQVAERMPAPLDNSKLEAQYFLGSFYAAGGTGLAKDLNKARYWLGRAAKAGHPKASSAFSRLSFLKGDVDEPTIEELNSIWFQQAYEDWRASEEESEPRPPASTVYKH
ncbi:MAG: sel1 repeat family protein [Deltaproteobacteria bacterium]|jgi:TPR repeat protein|nr:sel1 repeat family protein [Deltaproteobacteria bacterium]